MSEAIHPGPNWRRLEPDEIVQEDDLHLFAYVGCWIHPRRWGMRVSAFGAGPVFRKIELSYEI